MRAQPSPRLPIGCMRPNRSQTELGMGQPPPRCLCCLQEGILKRGVDVVIGTPGRVKDHLERGTLKLSQLK